MKHFLKYLCIYLLTGCFFTHKSNPLIGFSLDLSNNDECILFTKYDSENGSLYEYSIKDNSSTRITNAENSIHRNGVYIPQSNKIIYIDYQFGLLDSSRVMLLNKDNNDIDEIFKYPNIMRVNALNPDTIYFVSTSDIFKNRQAGADIYRYNGIEVEKLTSANFFSFFDIEISIDEKYIYFNSGSVSGGIQKLSLETKVMSKLKFPKGYSEFISDGASPVFSSDTSTMFLWDNYRIFKWDLVSNQLLEVVPHREGRYFLDMIQLNSPVISSDQSRLYFTTSNSQENGFIYCYESGLDTIFEIDLGLK